MFSRLLGKKEKKEQEQEQEQKQENEQDLYSASDAGDIESVRAALAGGQSANSRGGGGDRTCLMEAVRRGHEEVFTELLQQEDCDPFLEDCYKCTALHHACANGRVGMVRQLASHPRQCRVNSKNKWGDTAIMLAVGYGKAECVLALGRLAGVELDMRDREGRSLEERAR